MTVGVMHFAGVYSHLVARVHAVSDHVVCGRVCLPAFSQSHTHTHVMLRYVCRRSVFGKVPLGCKVEDWVLPSCAG